MFCLVFKIHYRAQSSFQQRATVLSKHTTETQKTVAQAESAEKNYRLTVWPDRKGSWGPSASTFVVQERKQRRKK